MDSSPVPASGAKRQSDRIRYAYRLRIAGKDATGNSFDEDGRSEVITRDGGLLVTTLSLTTGTIVKISRGPKSVDARIVGQCGLRGEEYLYGVQFVEALTEPFWEVHFPSLNPEGGVAKMVLQCSQCSRQDLFHLAEVEMMVYETMKVIPRRCGHCKQETLWLEPEILGEGSLVSGNAAYNLHAEQMPRRVRTVNDRKHSRVQMRNIKACLHRDGFADDIVTVTDLSRGGIGFLSLIDYVPGTTVEVAVPFTDGAGNVFTPARIVRVRCRPTVDIPGEFGLEYNKR